MTFGQQVISELGKRGERGMYFSFAEYGSLRRAKDSAELEAFLAGAGFVDIPAAASPAEIVDFIRAVEAKAGLGPKEWATVGVSVGLLAYLATLPLLGEIVIWLLAPEWLLQPYSDRRELRRRVTHDQLTPSPTARR